MHTAAMVTQSNSVCYERKGLTLPGELLIVCGMWRASGDSFSVTCFLCW